jgi:hypothetical protein
MSFREKWHFIATGAREKWTRHHRMILGAWVLFVSAVTAVRLAKALPPLLWGATHGDAVDTKIFHVLVHRWFASLPVYSELGTAVHPPATYVMLWPFFGWLEIMPARWFWAATMIAALVWLTYIAVRESGAGTTLERAFVALLPLSSYATAFTMRNGQLAVHVLPPLLAGLLLLQRKRSGWGHDLLPAALVLFALVKPNISVPFLWIVLLLPGRLRPAVLVAAGYAALTLFAASFQEAGLIQLLHDSLARGSALATKAGSANLHVLLTAVGLKNWILPISLLVFLALGLWIYRHRDVDFWLLLAVSALVARFWAYHRLYDELLLLPPQIALFRLAKRGPSVGDADLVASALLAISAAGLILPIRFLALSTPWILLITVGNIVVWTFLLVFLLQQAGRERYARITLPELPIHTLRKDA